MITERPASYYDELYEVREVYHRKYRDSHYFPLWVQVEFGLRPFKEKRILDIGCGPGQFAAFLEDEGYRSYLGIDFSPKAIELARATCGLPVRVADAFSPEVLGSSYDVVVCMEVLEHIDRDQELVRGIRKGTKCFLSVPNYPDPGHVRIFRSEYAVRKRYYRYIDIEAIHFINNIYLVVGTRSDHRPGPVQWLLKTRERITLDSFIKRIKQRLL